MENLAMPLKIFIDSLSSSLGIWYIILFNFFGVVAIAVKACEYQFKNRNTILIAMLVSSIGWTLYFLLQSELVSAFANLIGIIQTIIFFQREKHKWANNKFWLFFFIIIRIILAVAFFEKWHDIFPLLGGILATLAYFVLNVKAYRYISFFSSAFWLTNSFCKVVILAIIADICSTISIVIGIIRYSLITRKEAVLANNDDSEKTKKAV